MATKRTATLPQTHKEALVLGLILSITAPDEEKARMAISMCEDFAKSMTEQEVEWCKAQALKELEMEEQGT